MTYGAILIDQKNAIDIGKAAEHLVCADLLLGGVQAYLSDQGLPYDVVADLNGKLLRIQVKGTCAPRNVNASGRAERLAYNFNIRNRGKNGQSRLTSEHCDLIACVALDIGAVAYFSINEGTTTLQLSPPGFEFKGNYQRNHYRTIDEFPFERVVGR